MMLRLSLQMIFLVMPWPIALMAQTDSTPKHQLTIYGQVMLDAGYDFNRVDPSWFDVLRPTKLLDENGELFSPQGQWFMGVRQSYFGAKSELQTNRGPLEAQFDFELMGTGDNAGQTTFRLRNAYVSWNRITVGQLYSLFMDIDVFPNTLEYWGPAGMPFFRNVQIAYTPLKNEKELFSFALERPGATADQGVYGREFKYGGLLDSVRWRFPVPDLSAEYRRNFSWGHLELGGILRYIRWEDESIRWNIYDFSGDTWAWGLNLSTNVKLGSKAVFRGSLTGGAGIQNYMDDADADIGVKRVFNDPVTPLTGKSIPMIGLTGFLDLNWNSRLTSSFGYSGLRNRTLISQLNTAYKSGDYILGNILYYPTKNLMMGIELQWARRENNDFVGDAYYNLPAADGNAANNLKLQCCFRYQFSQSLK